MDILNFKGVRKENPDEFEDLYEQLIIAYTFYRSERDLTKDLWSHSVKTDTNRLMKRSLHYLCVNLKNTDEAHGIKTVEAINHYFEQRDTHNYQGIKKLMLAITSNCPTV